MVGYILQNAQEKIQRSELFFVDQQLVKTCIKSRGLSQEKTLKIAINKAAQSIDSSNA